MLMMACRTTPIWTEQLRAAGFPEDLPVAFVSSGATQRQSVLVTTVARAADDAAEAGVGTPTLAVVGAVVRLREQLRWFDGEAEARKEAKESDVEAA